MRETAKTGTLRAIWPPVASTLRIEITSRDGRSWRITLFSTTSNTCRVCGNVAAVVAPVNERFDARCFDRNCGLRERHDVDADPESALMESIYQQCHQYLLATGEAERGGLWRRVHPAVVAHSMIGVVPPDLSIADLFAP